MYKRRALFARFKTSLCWVVVAGKLPLRRRSNCGLCGSCTDRGWWWMRRKRTNSKYRPIEKATEAVLPTGHLLWAGRNTCWLRASTLHPVPVAGPWSCGWKVFIKIRTLIHLSWPHWLILSVCLIRETRKFPVKYLLSEFGGVERTHWTSDFWENYNGWRWRWWWPVKDKWEAWEEVGPAVKEDTLPEWMELWWGCYHQSASVTDLWWGETIELSMAID